MTKLTEAERIWLSRLSDEWTSVVKLSMGPRARSGVSSALARMQRKGLTDWTVIGGNSHYRITPAGRDALNESAPDRGAEREVRRE